MGGSRYEIFAMLVEAVKAGLGVALMPRFFVLDELAAGVLVVPCPHVLHSQHNYYLAYPEDKQRSESLQTFCAWLRAQAANYLGTGSVTRK
jgi:DNA-binding transcriptional LysR family regulator